MKITLSANAKLPLKVCRGTSFKRYKLAERLNEKLYNELATFDVHNCPVQAFKNALNRVIAPHKIDYKIENITNNETSLNYIAALGKYIDLKINKDKSPKEIIIKGFKFLLPIKNNKISNKIAALHEARHFFDHICNPKTTEFNTAKLHSQAEIYNRRSNVYNIFVSSYEQNLDLNIISESAKMHLDSIPDEYAIDVLNSIRYNIKSEINAYKDEIKFLKKSKANKQEIRSLKTFIKSAKFKEKLKIANKLLSDRLQTARENLKNIQTQKNMLQ